MAGFEVVVRPVVFPNIRPAPSRSLPPEDDPTKGFCVIKGSSGKVIDLPMSWSVSTSKTRPQEVERTVDEVRVYQKRDDGTVNKKNFVDVNIIKKIKIADPIGVKYKPATAEELLPKPKKTKPPITETTYAPPYVPSEGFGFPLNIEILNNDVVKKNPEYVPEADAILG
jgi:hypothetical protein